MLIAFMKLMEGELFNLIRYILTVELRNRFPQKISFLTEVFGAFLSLSIYWYTSKAFASNFEIHLGPYQASYFHFVLIGELIILLPSALLLEPAKKIKEAMINGVLDSLILTPRSIQQSVLYLSLSCLGQILLHGVILISLAIVFFDFSLPLEIWPTLLVHQIFALPAFLGLGLIAAAIFVTFGRGEGVVSYLSVIASFAAGVYFPVTVLPHFIQKFGTSFSPFNSLVEGGRDLLANGVIGEKFINSFLQLGIWGGISFILGWFLLGWSFSILRKRGEHLVIRF